MSRSNRKIIYKTDEEIELIRASCLLVCKALSEVGSMIKPGMTGIEIDTAAEAVIRDHGAVPAFKGYGGFPATLCVSVNEQVVHGIPTKQQIFKDGDIVSVDCGVIMDGYCGDSAYTFLLGDVDEATRELCKITNTSLYLAIEQAIAGNRIGDISHAVQRFTEKERNYTVVRELVGHGIGQNLHEAPDVPNYGMRGRGPKMKEGLVIAIEPMINLGGRHVRTLDDGWTVFTKDKKPSAHYEHTIAVKEGRADILSNHEIVEAAIATNSNVQIAGVSEDILTNVS